MDAVPLLFALFVTLSRNLMAKTVPAAPLSKSALGGETARIVLINSPVNMEKFWSELILQRET
jgi:hypothetical protein